MEDMVVVGSRGKSIKKSVKLPTYRDIIWRYDFQFYITWGMHVQPHPLEALVKNPLRSKGNNHS